MSGPTCAVPMTPAAASFNEGQRFSGSFSSMRVTASARSGGQSGRSSRIAWGTSWIWAYIVLMALSLMNGFRPTSSS